MDATDQNPRQTIIHMVSLLMRVVSRLILQLGVSTGEEAMRRWWIAGGECSLSSSCDVSFESPDLVKYLPRDLMNDAASVDDRFNVATEGMLIVYDLFGVGEAEVD